MYTRRIQILATVLAGVLGAVISVAPDAFAENQVSVAGTTGSIATQSSSSATPLPNLATSQNTTVQIGGMADPIFSKAQAQYPGPTGGISANSQTWTGYCREEARTISTDIGSEEAISTIALTFDSNPASGIHPPTQVTFSLSQNGTSWRTITKSVPAVTTTSTSPVRVQLNISPQIARYIKVTFPVAIWVFARNYQVTYNPNLGLPQSESLSLQSRGKSTTPIQVNHLLSPWSSSVAGSSNIMLAYSGGPNQPSNSTWTVAKFLPMLAYINRNGTMMSHFFDTMLFLPFGPVTTTSGWNSYVANLFAPNEQLAALNQAMGQVDQTLHTPNTKENVILSLPLPAASATSAAGTRLQAETKAIQTLLADFSAANLNNLNLTGFYWDDESMTVDQPRDLQLVQNVGKLIQHDGQHFYWVPFFDANDIPLWKSLNMSAAFLQPNYYELTNPPLNRLKEATNLATQYGLGVEIEGGHAILSSQSKRNAYLNELTYFHNDQVEGNTVHAFYFGNQTLVNAAQSTNPAIRSLYRDTYWWVLGGYPYTSYLPTSTA